MKMWLDDVREPWKFGCVGWEWVKTASEAISVLSSGAVEQASLDHDLAAEHYPWNCTDIPPVGSGTGYDVVLWLEANPQFLPKGGVRVHSMNPVGRERMQRVIDRISNIRKSEE